MSDITTFVVRKGSPVWVCKGELPYNDTDKPYKFIPHKMKRDLTFEYPRVPGEDGPGVIALANLLPLIIEHKQRTFSECFVEAKANPFGADGPVRFSFLDLLEKGMSLFTTGIDEYPILAVFDQYVDEVKEAKWVKEDLGDGLSRHTLHPKFQTEYVHKKEWEEQHR